MVLGFVIFRFAIGAFVLAAAAIGAAALLPKRAKRASKAPADVKIILMDANGQSPPESVPQTRDEQLVHDASKALDTHAAFRPEANMEDVTREKGAEGSGSARVTGVAQQSEDAQRMSTTEEEVRRGFGSFLRFGMSRKREDRFISQSSSDEGAVQDVTTERAELAERPRRKLFSGKASVVRHVEAPTDAVVEGEGASKSDDVIASVTNDAGTTTVDSRGVIHEEPAETAFPLERFAENDRVQEVQYASEGERLEAEHRMEMERLAAEQQAYDAEHRRIREAKDAKHRRALEIVEMRARLRDEAVKVQAEAQAAVEAHLAKWWIRLDPDSQYPDETERIRLAASLEAVRAPWAGKLICAALEQDESERVRARLIGAYARAYRTESAPFAAAVERSQIERWAIIESLSPFADEAPWVAEILARAAPDSAAASGVQATTHADDICETPSSEASIIQLPQPPVVPAALFDSAVAAAS